MVQKYSRLASVEEKRNIKKATNLVILTVIAGVLLIFYGIPTLGRFAGFISDIAKGDKPIAKNDTTPPAPPQLDIPPKYTNQNGLTVSGQSEIGSIVKITLNDRESEIATDENGEFTKEISLIDGENIIKAKSVDSSGNESLETEEFKVAFDNTKPEIKIEKPGSGDNFYGTKQRQIQIVGKTEGEAQVYINSRFVAVDLDGSFEFTTSLSEGENKFNIKSTDLAGNLSEMDLTVNFTP